MSVQFEHGDRVVVSLTPRQRGTAGGLLSGPDEQHPGTVASVSVKGNVYVHLDGDHGQPVRVHPDKVRKVDPVAERWAQQYAAERDASGQVPAGWEPTGTRRNPNWANND